MPHVGVWLDLTNQGSSSLCAHWLAPMVGRWANRSQGDSLQLPVDLLLDTWREAPERDAGRGRNISGPVEFKLNLKSVGPWIFQLWEQVNSSPAPSEASVDWVSLIHCGLMFSACLLLSWSSILELWGFCSAVPASRNALPPVVLTPSSSYLNYLSAQLSFSSFPQTTPP